MPNTLIARTKALRHPYTQYNYALAQTTTLTKRVVDWTNERSFVRSFACLLVSNIYSMFVVLHVNVSRFYCVFCALFKISFLLFFEVAVVTLFLFLHFILVVVLLLPLSACFVFVVFSFLTSFYAYYIVWWLVCLLAGWLSCFFPLFI